MEHEAKSQIHFFQNQKNKVKARFLQNIEPILPNLQSLQDCVIHSLYFII